MNTPDRQRTPLSDEEESKVSHFIPSVELKGSPSERLQTLDTLITHLETLRRTLAGEALPSRGGFEGPSVYANARVWPWFGAGTLLGALLAFLMLFARSCAS